MRYEMARPMPRAATWRAETRRVLSRFRVGTTMPRAATTSRCPSPRVTAYTITQPGTLQRQLSAVLRDDYATTVEEMSLGACSVGVPVRRTRGDGHRDVVAALGIVVPTLKRDKTRLVSALQVAARGIGRAIS